MELIDGCRNERHIKASQVGMHNQGLIGPASYILNKGNNLGYQKISGNKIRILDGIVVIQGRRGYIKPGLYEEVTIENGSQREYRKDIIAVQYSKASDTGVEGFELVVVKGTSSTGTPALPELISSDINNEGMLHQEALYVVTVSDATITSVEGQLETLCSMADMIELDGSYDEKRGGWLKKLGAKVFAYAHAKTVIWSGTTTLYSKLSEVINALAVHKTGGDHDSRYYTETEVDSKINGHNHDGRYYTETEMDSKLGGKAPTNHVHANYLTQSEFKLYSSTSNFSFNIEPNKFSRIGGTSRMTAGNVVILNLYIKAHNNVLNNTDSVLVGTLNTTQRPTGNELFYAVDDVRKTILTGKINDDGSIYINGNGTEGEVYLLISFVYIAVGGTVG